MPQTDYLPLFTATYPLLAKCQKPGGIIAPVSRTTTAGSWAANVATLTVPSTTDYVGTVYTMTMSGFTPAGYNGTYQGTIASATTITYPLGTNPGGVVTVQGTVTYTACPPLVISTTVGAGDVPNKPTYSAGTIQSYDAETGQLIHDKIAGEILDRVQDRVEAHVAVQPSVEEEEEEDEDDDGKPRMTPPKRRR